MSNGYGHRNMYLLQVRHGRIGTTRAYDILWHGVEKKIQKYYEPTPNKWVSISKFRHLHNIRNRENHWKYPDIHVDCRYIENNSVVQYVTIISKAEIEHADLFCNQVL